MRNHYVAPPALLNGTDICALLAIKPSPRVGLILEALADAQVEGIVQSVEDAIRFVKGNYGNGRH